MAIYAATLPGRAKRVLVRAENQTEAMRRFVKVEALSADEMQDALDSGETVWKPGAEFPADAAAEQYEQPEGGPAADES